MTDNEPKDLFLPIVDIEACVGDHSCVDVCETSCISLVNGKARINYDDCLACGACEAACPTKAITHARVPIDQWPKMPVVKT